MMQKADKFIKIFIFFIIITFFKIEAKEYELSIYETHVNYLLNIFAKKMEEEFSLICIGDGGSMPYDVESISIMFNAYRRATIAEARELEVLVVEKFIKMINSYEKIRPYLREYPFKADRVNVSISFHKLDNTPYDDGSISRISNARNRIFYYSNHQGISADLEEPYEEALKIVQNDPSKKVFKHPNQRL